MPGIEVVHVHDEHDVYGGRGSGTYMLNREPPDRGWLGNPYHMADDSMEERIDVIVQFAHAFIDKLRSDEDFRLAVDGLAGQRVACWCRHENAIEPPCHLDVVDRYVTYGIPDAYYFAEEMLPMLYLHD